MQRRRLRGDDHDDEVDVGGDRPPPLRHVRVGAREQAAAGQHRGDAVTVAPPLEEHLVADGEVALLAAGEVGAAGSPSTSAPSSSTVQAPAAMPVTAPRVAVGAGRRRPAWRPASSRPSCAELRRRAARAGTRRARAGARPVSACAAPPCAAWSLVFVSLRRSPLSRLGEHRLESSALLLIHRWMSPSGEVRHDRARGERDAESRPGRRCAQRRRRAPGASPTTEEERRTTASPAAGKPQRSGDPGCYGRALTRGDAKMPLTDGAVITFLLVVRGTRLGSSMAVRRSGCKAV